MIGLAAARLALRFGLSVGFLVPDSLICAALGPNAGFFFRLAEIERVCMCISPQILGYILSRCFCMSGTDYCVMVGLLEMYRFLGVLNHSCHLVLNHLVRRALLLLLF